MIRARSNGNHSAVVEHYARLAPKYDRRWDRYTRRTLATLINRIDMPHSRHDAAGLPPWRILDVACGTGRLEEMILDFDPDAHITGVDISREMIEIAKQRVPESAGRNVRWVVAPAEELPVDDDTIDVVACANAFHLVADPCKTLAEFRRVLRPGGRLVIIDWCGQYPTMAAVLILSRIFGRQYRRIQTVSGLSRTLEQSGFSVIHTEKFKATWFWGMMCVVAEASQQQ